MKIMKTFKVSPDLLEHLENVLKRAHIQYIINNDGTVSAPISGSLFHKFVIRARCEKLDYEKEGIIVTNPHVHVSELKNPHIMNNINSNGYIVVGTK